jgi:hypothetical protein
VAPGKRTFAVFPVFLLCVDFLWLVRLAAALVAAISKR